MKKLEKDFRLHFSEDERIQLLEIVNICGSIETILAHNPDLIPLDVFLDWSQFTHRFLSLYTNDLYEVHPISYKKLENLLKQLKIWQSDFKENWYGTDESIFILMAQAMQKSTNLWTNLTVGKATTEQPA